MGRRHILILALAVVGCTNATDIEDLEGGFDSVDVESDGAEVGSHTEALFGIQIPFFLQLAGIANNEAYFNNIRVNMNNFYYGQPAAGIAQFTIYNSSWGQARIVADFHVDCDGEPDKTPHIDWILEAGEERKAFTSCSRINISQISGTIDN